MKYHAVNQIDRIARLQNEAKMHVAQAKDALIEADELTKELRAEHGQRFVCGDIAWKLEHRAIGFEPGNRDWLVRDSDVKVIES